VPRGKEEELTGRAITTRSIRCTSVCGFVGLRNAFPTGLRPRSGPLVKGRPRWFLILRDWKSHAHELVPAPDVESIKISPASLSNCAGLRTRSFNKDVQELSGDS
jgi:hypothetical protein